MAPDREATVAQLGRVLSSFYPSARAEVVASALARSSDPLAAAVRLLQQDAGAADEALAAALDEAAVPAPRIAQLLGSTVVEVNGWLDDPLLLVPPRYRRVGPPLRLRVARAVVRGTWVVLGLLAVAAIVSSRGGVVPCPTDLCIDGVDVLLADGSAVPAPSRSVFSPTDVVGVRFDHRAAGSRAVTVAWTVDGDQLESVLVRLVGTGRTTVEAPGGRLPTGVHVVSMLDPVPGGSATFVVE